ncbi:MAG: acyl--CoA ligase [bacterium]|nr:acyl--CoA ligase [bacterium]
MSVHGMLLDSAARRPSAIALTHEDRHVSFTELAGEAARIARFLREQGVRRGDRVALLLENSPEYVAACFGIMQAGACCVALNHANKAATHQALLRDSGAVALWTGRSGARDLAVIARDCPAMRFIVADGVDPVLLLPPGIAIYDPAAVCAGEPLHDAGEAGAGDLALILYTSGSTGAPRGVVLTHGNLEANTSQILAYLKLQVDDSVCCVLPFHYSFGNSLLLTHVRCGGRVVIENRFAFPQQVLATMVREHCTAFSGVPSHFAILCGRTDFLERPPADLRQVTQAGGAMAPDLTRRIREALPPQVELHIMYGQTEASARLATVPPERLREKYGSIGRAIPGVSLTVRRTNGSECDVGETGEIVAAGPNIMRGYWNAPEETAAVLSADGLHTGDLAYRDADGYLFIVDRMKNMIKAGANRVGSIEIEETLLTHPAVMEACVVGVPDALLGEAIEAWVVTVDPSYRDEQVLLRHCAGVLAAFKIPRCLHFVDALPRNASGKVLKAALRGTPASSE